MMICLLLVCLPIVWTEGDAGWSKEIAAYHGREEVVRFRARIERGYIIIRATHQDGWHTYAMDNELRAAEALQGKTSLGIEQGIEIKAVSGLELEQAWLQTAPQDLSTPQLRWFTYGFDKQAYFACRIQRVTADQATLRVTGQACNGDTCSKVDVQLELDTTLAATKRQTPPSVERAELPRKGLVPVRKSKAQAAPAESANQVRD
jgi:hypothetical protein